MTSTDAEGIIDNRLHPHNRSTLVSLRNLLHSPDACRPPPAARPLLRPRPMVGADARLVVARYLARRTRLDRQLHTRRSCGLVAESGRVAARDRLSRRPPIGSAPGRERECRYG